MPSPSRMMRENASITRKLSRGRRAPPAAGSCWCRDRARHRSGRTHPARRRAAIVAIVARMPIRRPPAPPGPWRAPVRRGVEAGRPGLVVHRNLSPRRSSELPGSARRRGGDSRTSEQSVDSGGGAAQLWAAGRTWREPLAVLVKAGLVLYLKPTPCPLISRQFRRHHLMNIQDTAASAIRLRHRPAGEAQGGPHAAARRKAATPTTSTCRTRPMPYILRCTDRARPDQVDRHRRRQGDAGRARDLHRRGPQGLRHASSPALPFKSRDGSDMKKPGRADAADRQGALRRRPDRLRGGRDRCCRPRMPPKPSRSTSSRCRSSPRRARPTPTARRRSSTTCPDNVALDYHYGDADKVNAAFAERRAQGQAQDSSTRGWSSTRWSRAPRSANTTRPRNATRCIRCSQGVMGLKAGIDRRDEDHAGQGAHPHRQCRRLVRHEGAGLSGICLHPARRARCSAAR